MINCLMMLSLGCVQSHKPKVVEKEGNMKKFTFIILCICLLFNLASCSANMSNNTTLADKAQAIADTIVRDYGSVSVQYAIIDGGNIILSGSSGVYDKTENRPVTKDDMFGIGSTSKMFVTAATMMLADRGLLDIDAPLTTYIPEFRMADDRYKKITPRMLMNHSSGIYGSSFSNSFLFDAPDKTAHDTLLGRLAAQGLKADPGEMSDYCNDGFSLLEILVERVSGISYTEFLAKNICQPLGLTHTKTPQDNFDRAQLVKVYLPIYDGALPNDTVNTLGTGGLYSTAEDLCRFAEALMGNKTKILSGKSASLMQNEEYKKGLWPEDHAENLFGYGLGWDTVHGFPFGDYGIKAVVKGGDTQMFHSSLVAIPEYNIAMAVISSGGASAIDYAFAATVLQELLLKKGIIKQISPLRTFETPVQCEMPKELSAYTGLYANTGSQSNIEVKDGVLTVTSPAGKTKYIYAGDNIFKSEGGSVCAKFVQTNDGNTYLQFNKYFILRGVGQLAASVFDCKKIKPVSISETVLKSWSRRAGMKYYLVNEKPTSQAYFMDSSVLRIKLNDDLKNGYAYSGTRIVDENYAVNTLKFRDATDLVFRMQDGVEYLKANDLVYIREDFIPKMTADTAVCIIGMDTYAKYYSIDANIAGRTMVVKLPDGAAYAVYDKNDVCVNFTTVSHNNTTVLPANGKVSFIGKAGDVFEFRLQ